MNIQEPLKTADEQLCRMREQATKLLDCLCTELGTGITQAMAELRATIATSEPCKHAEDSERLDWLEGELGREAESLKEGYTFYHAVFRRNTPIKRSAIDAARLASDELTRLAGQAEGEKNG